MVVRQGKVRDFTWGSMGFVLQLSRPVGIYIDRSFMGNQYELSGFSGCFVKQQPSMNSFMSSMCCDLMIRL